MRDSDRAPHFVYRRTMKNKTRIMTMTLAALASLLVFGFVVFGIVSTRGKSQTADIMGDGIVVLTGGEARIQAAAKLLSDQKAKRLLISGVNKSTNRADLLLLSGLKKETFSCCVDLGYQALNTAGNAHEARAWANKHNFKRIIVVTSAYHMPRSLMELGRVLPGTEIIPFTVMPKSMRKQRWWLHGTTMRVLFSEYIKFLPSAARYAASRILGSWGGTPGAENAHAEL